MTRSTPDSEPGLAPPVVKLSGEVDLAVAPALQEQLDLLSSAGASTIVVDLLDATFIDSIALGVLVSGLDRCRAAGGDLLLLVTSPRILKVLEITGLSTIFSIHSSRDDLPGRPDPEVQP
jgi:anti-sigma B factor antagonist